MNFVLRFFKKFNKKAKSNRISMKPDDLQNEEVQQREKKVVRKEKKKCATTNAGLRKKIK